MKYEVINDGFIIDKISKSERKEIIMLVERFKETDLQAPQMGDKLLDDLEKNKFTIKTLKQFSKWCNSRGPRYPYKPQERAREISFSLFKRTIPRLCDTIDKVQKQHKENLKKFLIELKEDEMIQKAEFEIK